MQMTYSMALTRAKEEETSILHISLQGLLHSGLTFALNLKTRTLSLLSDGPLLLMEQQLSVNEMHMLIPTLESFPHYCPYEVLLAHISGQTVNSASIERCRYVLQEAQSRGTWQQELRPIRRALSSLRTKLHFFGLEVSNIRERGCSLTSLTTQGSSLNEDIL
jgi:hypothetical protein